MKLIEVGRPIVSSFVICGNNNNEFTTKLKETKQLIVDVRKQGKTRLDISVQSGSTRYGANFPSQWAKENSLKFDRKEEYSFLSGEKRTPEYFKLKKGQGKPELMKHIESLVRTNILPRFGISGELIDEISVYVQLPIEYIDNSDLDPELANQN